MKKTLSLILAVLLLCPLLTGCNTGGVKQTNESLTLWLLSTGGYSSDYNDMSLAISAFEKTYPDVTLNIEKHNTTFDIEEQTAYYKKLGAAVMAGDGPDLILSDVGFSASSDLYKMQKAGAFVDLTDFMKKDSDFHIEEFVQPILDGMKYQEKQYVMPLGYSIPVFYSTKEAFAKSEINLSNCNTSSGLLDELYRYRERNTTKDSPQLFPDPKAFKFFYQYCNLPIIDHENATANLDNAIFKKGLEFWKIALPLESNVSGTTYFIEDVPKYFSTGEYAIGLQNMVCLRDYCLNMRALEMMGEPLAFPWRDESGGIQARVDRAIMISNSSPNKQNAWNFIKLMLSKETQDKFSYSPGFSPIRKDSWEVGFDLFSREGVIGGGALQDSKGLSASVLEDFKKLQDEITGSYMRFPADRDFYNVFIPYFEGKKSYDEVIKEAQTFLDIYLSE